MLRPPAARRRLSGNLLGTGPLGWHRAGAPQLTRELGVTWARIGAARGMTRQSGWERFSGEE
jgi:hypothetical protein